MAPEHAESTEQERLLDEVATAYIKAREAGQAPDPRDWLARYPQLAADLEVFFADQEELERLAGPLQVVARAARGAAEPLIDFGDYELLGELARGGMGVVYRARQKSLNRVVALKMIPPGGSAEEMRRFRNEAETAAGLDHPGIVPVHEVGEHKGQLFFSMKLLEGGSLAACLGQFRDEPRRAAGLLMEVARAVHHAHQHGVLHRDLKPSNILLDEQGRPHVADFGLARRLQADTGLTATGAVVGTPGYMAPEQASGQKGAVSTASDVYGLGAVLYALLTGRPPFQAETVLETLAQLKEREPEPPGRCNRRVDRDLETICLKCLQKEPQRRYGSAEALAEDLCRFLEHLPIHARRPTVWQRASKWAGRHQGVVLAALAGLLVAMSTLALSVWQIERAREEAIRQRDVAEENARDVAARERELQQRLYPADINRAHRLWQLGNHAHARDVLRRQVPQKGQEDLRGFEWYFLWDRCQREEPRTLRGHRHAYDVAISPDGKTKISLFVEKNNGRVYDVAFSPDGKTLATASQDCTVGLWDVEGGRLLATLDGHAKEVDCVWFSPDGRLLASHSGDGTIHLWDVATRRRLKVLAREGADVCGVHFRPDGRLITSVYRKGPMRMEIWDPQTGGKCELSSGEVEPPRTVAFSRDGKAIAVAGDLGGAVTVWDVHSGKHLRSLNPGRADTLAFGPTGKLAVAAGTGSLHGAGSYQQEFVFPADASASAVAFSPDGARLVLGGEDQMLQVWDLNALMREEPLGIMSSRIFGVAFSPDGSMVAAGDFDGVVKLYRLPKQRPEPLLHFKSDAWVGRVVPSSDGKCLLIHQSLPGKVEWLLVDRETGLPRSTVAFKHDLLPDGSCYSPDGRFVAIWNARELRLLLAATGRQCFYSPGSHQVAFAPDSSTFATLEAAGEISLRELPAMALVRRFPALPAGQVSLAFSPDGRTLVAGYATGELRTWDARSGAGGGVWARGSDRAHFLVFSPGGDLLATAGEQGDAIQFWDVSGRRPLRSATCSSRMINGMAFAPDGKTLAVSQRNQVALFHVATGQELFTLEKHRVCHSSVTFAPDGQSLVTGVARAPQAGKDRWKLIRWDAPRPR
jgi:WD40 repeat protein/serine/threonine protein kinase